MKIKRNILLNPGPATTTDSVKAAQVVPDICPREKEFGQMMKDIRNNLVEISGGGKGYTCVLFAGSGTAAIDAIINSVVPPEGKILIINNGAYGQRIVQIARAYNINYAELKFKWESLPDLNLLKNTLIKDKEISCVAFIHHETTTGILNPLKKINQIAKSFGCVTIVDTISSFAGVSINIIDDQIDFMMLTSNKCIQGMAGICFVICKTNELEKIKNYPKRSFYLDLYSQYDYFEKKGEMQFTPPVQVVYALKKAIDELFEEGLENRYKRYLKSNQTLIKGMEELGFKKLLKDEEESHILTTFCEPDDPNYDFEKMHDLLYKRGFTIYPGKIGKRETFRLANMGAINYNDIGNFLKVLKEVIKEIKLKLK